MEECREAKSFSQVELTKQISSHHIIVSKYEHNKVKPAIGVVKTGLSLGQNSRFLLGETKQVNVLKVPTVLKRLNDIEALPDTDKKYILYALDGLLRDAKARAAYK